MFSVIRKDCNGNPVTFNALYDGQKLLLECNCTRCGEKYWTSNYKPLVNSNSSSEADSDEANAETGTRKSLAASCGKCRKCTKKDIEKYQVELKSLVVTIETLQCSSKFDDYNRKTDYSAVLQYMWEKFMIINTRLATKTQHLKSIRSNKPPPPSSVEASS